LRGFIARNLKDKSFLLVKEHRRDALWSWPGTALSDARLAPHGGG